MDNRAESVDNRKNCRLQALSYKGDLPPTIERLVARLADLGSVDAETLTNLLTECSVSAEELAGVIQFSEERYVRIRLNDHSDFEVLILCWLPGQETPIHDHAGSLCGVKVLSGQAHETSFTLFGRDGEVKPFKVGELTTGTITVAEDVDVHSIQAAGSDPLITLHVYAPPLGTGQSYFVAD